MHTPFEDLTPPPEYIRLESLEPVPPPVVMRTFHPMHRHQRETRMIQELACIGFGLYAVVIGAKYHYARVKDENLIALVLLTNIQVFCEEEIDHLLAGVGWYDHEPPLAYWYRFYSVAAQLMRLPLFYFYLQPGTTQYIREASVDASETQQLFWLLLEFMILQGTSMLYSLAVNPSNVIPQRQMGLFFRKDMYSPVPSLPITPVSSPTPPAPSPNEVEKYLSSTPPPRTMQSFVTDVTDGTDSPCYEAVDLVRLPGGRGDFFKRLFNEGFANTPTPPITPVESEQTTKTTSATLRAS